MASTNGYYKTTFRGITYRKELDPPDEEALAAEAAAIQEAALEEGNNISYEDCYARVAQADKLRRLEKAKEELKQQNTDKHDQKVQPTPQIMVPGGGVKSGDPGISQRYAEKPQVLTGAKPETDPYAGITVISDKDMVDSLPSLAERLNSRAQDLSSIGFITKKIEPSGNGDYYNQIVDMAYQLAGAGDRMTQLAQTFKLFDRYEHSMAPKAMDRVGFTFITRPRLNLSDSNLVGDRRFNVMRSSDNVADVPFAIRCILDTQYCKDHGQEASACPLINTKCAFNMLLGNCLTSISGFVDPMLATETTDSGYFQEDQTYAIGGDRLARTYELTLNFKDVEGSPVAALFDYWYQYMANIQDGSMIQYADAIDANRLDYTVSIYRFLMDRSNRTITKWAKATGCFPCNAPSGVPFNKGQGESIVTANDNFAINFKANRLEYNDPIIIHEFNVLARRYMGMAKEDVSNKFAYALTARNNFCGVPYIRIGNFGYELIAIPFDDENVNTVKTPEKSISGIGEI